jgi:hypothetical protein
MIRGIRFRTLFVLCAALAGWGCDESLPPREDPEVVLVPTMSLSGSVVTVNGGRVASGGNILLSIRNVYDDVLSEKALVRGSVVLFLKERPDSVRILTYGYNDLVTQGLLIGTTFTLPVQKTAEFVQPWDQRTSGGSLFWELGVRFNRRTTSKGEVYYESDPLHLVVEASMQIFERVQASRFARREFTITYELWNMSAPNLARTW